MYCLYYLGMKGFETVLLFQGLKGWKGPIMPKGRSLLHLWVFTSTLYQKLAPPLLVNQYVTSSPLSIQLYKSSGKKRLLAWCSWLSVHLAYVHLAQATWPLVKHALATLALTTPVFVTQAFSCPDPALH